MPPMRLFVPTPVQGVRPQHVGLLRLLTALSTRAAPYHPGGSDDGLLVAPPVRAGFTKIGRLTILNFISRPNWVRVSCGSRRAPLEASAVPYGWTLLHRLRVHKIYTTGSFHPVRVVRLRLTHQYYIDMKFFLVM